jgi:Integrase zinc binding domain
MDREPGRIRFPEDVESRRAILQQYHDHPLAGHPGIRNTIALALRHFEDTKALRAFIEEYVKGCVKVRQDLVLDVSKSGSISQD